MLVSHHRRWGPHLSVDLERPTRHGLQRGVPNSLIAKLHNAIKALADANENNDTCGCT